MKYKSFKRIGLLGGSFNPAHVGHLHISKLALKILNLDEIWWLVTPQNPLKSTLNMASYSDRLQYAKITAKHPRIIVSDFEKQSGLCYSADTIMRLTQRHNSHRFIWLMGADNLCQIHHWRDWQYIFNRLPIAVFARSGYNQRSFAGKAALKFAQNRVNLNLANVIVDYQAPAWVFLPIRRNKISATIIREKIKLLS